MTHIGYVYVYHIVNSTGVVIDSHKIAHLFVSDTQKKYSRFQFVTYEGEGDVVEDVIPLSDYPRYERYQEGMKFYLQNGVGSWNKYYLINKDGQRYALNGAEAFVVNKLFRGEEIIPSNISSITEEEYRNQVLKIIECVNFVCSHLQEIADSYEVNITSNHISKIGGDDKFIVDRHVKLSYRDVYINRFFLQDANLFSESGYTSHFEHSYKIGRQSEEESDAKYAFLNSYDKTEHMIALLYELDCRIVSKALLWAHRNQDFAENWGVGDDDGILSFGFDVTIERIKAFNNRGMKMME